METEETLPFPPPFTRLLSPQRRELASCTQLPCAPSLEQLTEARLAELSNQGCLWQTPPPRSAESVLASENTGQQIVLASHEPTVPVPLRWRGQPVSEELQLYASRVARGEDLAPYRGPILANSSLERWVAAEGRTLRKTPRSGARPLFLLAAVATLAAFVLPNLQPDVPKLEQPPPVTSLAQPAPAPLAITPLASLQSEPSPQAEPVREQQPLELPGAGPPAVSPSSRAPGAAAASLPSGGLPSASPPAPTLQAAAQARAVQPGAQDPPFGAPSSDTAAPTMLLVDEPSF